MAGGFAKIRSSLQRYLIALLLSALASLLDAALLGTSYAGVISGFSSSASSCASATAAAMSAGSSAAQSGIGLIGLVALIVDLLAWLQWRSGAIEVRDAALYYGAAAEAAASRSRQEVTWVLYVFLGGLVLEVGIVVAAVLSALPAALNRTGPSNATLAACQIEHSVAGALFVTAIVALLVALLLYWLATESHLRLLRTFPPPGPVGSPRTAQGIILLGAVVSALGLLVLVAPSLAIVSIASPILLLYGFYRLRTIYDRWLSRPPAGPPTATATPYSGPPGSS